MSPLTDYLSDAALVLVGHGATVNARSTATTYQHGEELRRRRIFRQVRECFWKVEPGINEVLRDIAASRVFIMPLFLSQGYFTEQAIPCEIGLKTADEPTFARTQQRGAQTVFYCRPIGTHPRITEVILARARDVVVRHPFPRAPKPAETALIVASHGTTKTDRSRQAADSQVEAIRGKGLYVSVHAVFLEEAPGVEETYTLAQAESVVVVPFFMSEGLHTAEDLPVRLGETPAAVETRLKSGRATWRNPTEKRGKRIWIAGCIGTEPLIADLILERVQEAFQEQR